VTGHGLRYARRMAGVRSPVRKARRAYEVWSADANRWEGAPRRWGPNTGHPNEAARNRVVYRQMSAALSYAASRFGSGRLLDIGCGTKPWQPTFAPYVDVHIGADHEGTLHGLVSVDVVSDAYAIPLEDDSFDTILLTEVLEHLERPQDALAECARLLRPRGHLILTTPFAWPLHEEPRDFFRYTPHGLRYLVETAGLEVVELRPLSGIWTTISLQFAYAMLRHRPRAPALVDALAVGTQRLAWELDRLDRQDLLSWNHLLVARRPEPGSTA
jgi:SAM-dependent methyltransferase